METDDEEQLQWKGGGQFSKRKEGRSTSFETDTRPSNSGGPISRQSCYYASFSPPHGTSELMADKEDEGGGKKKAFCSSVCERERERDALLFHTHTEVSSGARGCWSLRGFFFPVYPSSCVPIQLIPLFQMPK